MKVKPVQWGLGVVQVAPYSVRVRAMLILDLAVVAVVRVQAVLIVLVRCSVCRCWSAGTAWSLLLSIIWGGKIVLSNLETRVLRPCLQYDGSFSRPWDSCLYCKEGSRMSVRHQTIQRGMRRNETKQGQRRNTSRRREGSLWRGGQRAEQQCQQSKKRQELPKRPLQ